MAIRELTSAQIEQLVGARHSATGMEYPPFGLQPYYDWLINSMHRLAEASSLAAALKVQRDSAGDTALAIAGGRASLDGVMLDYPGETLDVSAYGNSVVYLWLWSDCGSPRLGAAAQATGWPETPHLKLAEVAVAEGQIASILDRRGEAMLGDTSPATLTGIESSSFLVNRAGDLARLCLDTNHAAGNYTLSLSPADLTAQRRWIFPDVSDTVVGLEMPQTLSNKTLSTPIITDFSSAGHSHVDAASGGQLTDAALSQPVSLAKGGTGATDAPTARAKLGLGSLATLNLGDVATSASPLFTGGVGTPQIGNSPTQKLIDLTVPALLDAYGNIILDWSSANSLSFFGAAAVTQPAATEQNPTSPTTTIGDIAAVSISDPPTQTEMQNLRDKCESLAGDFRADHVLLLAIRAALVNLGLIRGSA